MKYRNKKSLNFFILSIILVGVMLHSYAADESKKSKSILISNGNGVSEPVMKNSNVEIKSGEVINVDESNNLAEGLDSSISSENDEEKGLLSEYKKPEKYRDPFMPYYVAILEYKLDTDDKVYTGKPEVDISFILYYGSFSKHNRAIVNNEIVEIGDEVDGSYRVEAILENAVVFEKRDERWTIGVVNNIKEGQRRY